MSLSSFTTPIERIEKMANTFVIASGIEGLSDAGIEEVESAVAALLSTVLKQKINCSTLRVDLHPQADKSFCCEIHIIPTDLIQGGMLIG